MKTLITERAIISPLAITDFEEILGMYHEPDSNKFITPLLNKTDEEYLAFLHFKLKTNDSPKGLGFWVVRAADTQQFLGTVNLNVMELLGFVHIGAHMSRASWGQGYATEALTALKNYGLNDLNLPTIHGICSQDHHVSQKMLQAIGLHYDKIVDLRGESIFVFKVENRS